MAKSHYSMVSEFNRVLGNGVRAKPGVPSAEQQQLRMTLIEEEAVDELGKAMFENNLIEVADAIADSLVVIYGAANDWGLVCDSVYQDHWSTRPTLGAPPMAVQTERLDKIHHLAITRLQTAMDTGQPLVVEHAIKQALAIIYAAADDWGIDIDPVLREVHRSNMSKLCHGQNEAEYAVARYAAGEGYQNQFQPIETAFRQCRAAGFKDCFVIFNAKTGKTLKGPRYQTPQLELLLDQLKQEKSS